MIQMTLSMLTLTIGVIFIQMNHPLAMGLLLLVQTLMICLMTGLMAKTFWFSYILFLVFLGGMLVLFIYVTSLASNEMFSLSMKSTISALMLFMMMMMLMGLLMDSTSTTSLYMNNEMEMISCMTSFTTENSLSLKSLYNFPMNIMTIMLMNYLLVTLIVVVKITNLFYGPLRLMN